ncbi:MAG: sugar ABC transporter permease [Clostridiales bacterium]|nr:sugar ABC transporter permease [Clostridiales bacterium]
MIKARWGKPFSVILIILSALCIITTLVIDAAGMTLSYRGHALIAGIVGLAAGFYFLPVSEARHIKIINVLFLIPMVGTFAVTVIIPFLMGIFYSTTDWDGIKFENFVGFENYINMFKEPDYLYSFGITFLFTVVNMALVNFFAFALALLCTSNSKVTGFCRAAFFIPNLIGGIVLGYVWQFIFNKVFILAAPPSMLTNANLALVAILIVSTWQYSGYIMMIYITGLQTIPKDVIEASGIDGASWWRQLFKIKIPMIANTFTVCTFLTLVNSFKQFDLNIALTNGAPQRVIDGRAVYATEFLALNIYKTAITKHDYAIAQTKAILFFVILAVISITQVVISKRNEVEI